MHKSFFLAPYAGVGYSGVKYNYAFPVNTNFKNITSLRGGVDAGIFIKNIRLSTGISYMTTGDEYDAVIAYLSLPPQIDTVNVRTRYDHLLLPINIGYRIKLLKKLSVCPTVGASISWNMGATTKAESKLANRSNKGRIEDFTNIFHPVSVFANGSVVISYNVTQRIAIMLNPSYNYMLTNILKTPTNAAFSAIRRHYVWHINGGIMLLL